MRVRAGERSRETGTYVCVECLSVVRVVKGERFPNCPCGRDEYELRRQVRADR